MGCFFVYINYVTVILFMFEPNPEREISYAEEHNRIKKTDDGILLINKKTGESFLVENPPVSRPSERIHQNSPRTPAIEAWIRKHVKSGATYKSIAQALDITEKTLYNWFDRTPKFKYQLDIDRLNRTSHTAMKNVEQAVVDGDTAMSKWWLTNAPGARDVFHAKAEIQKEEESAQPIMIINPHDVSEETPEQIEQPSTVQADEETMGSFATTDEQ